MNNAEWLKKMEYVTVSEVMERVEEKREAIRTHCSACGRPFVKSRPRANRLITIGGTTRETYLSWCRECHLRQDRGVHNGQRYSIYDKETHKELATFGFFYLDFQRKLLQLGFELEGIYTNLPVDKEVEYFAHFRDNQQNKYDYPMYHGEKLLGFVKDWDGYADILWEKELHPNDVEVVGCPHVADWGLNYITEYLE